jgi:hypothetical protein
MVHLLQRQYTIQRSTVHHLYESFRHRGKKFYYPGTSTNLMVIMVLFCEYELELLCIYQQKCHHCSINKSEYIHVIAEIKLSFELFLLGKGLS